MSGDGRGTGTGSAPLRVAVTGTPGTGKTTATDLLAGDGEGPDCEVIHLNDAIREHGLHEGEDAERGSLVADLDSLAEWVDDRVAASAASVVVLESHLAHHLDADRVAVLRCAPEELETRLRERGDDAEKASENSESAEQPRALARSARENSESEALDIVLSEAVARHGPGDVYEIDTTGRDPDAVAADLRAVVEGTREPSAGEVDFTGYL